MSILRITILILFTELSAFSQTPQPNLVKVLGQLEERFNCRFSYEESIVANKNLSIELDSSARLSEWVYFLEHAIQLKFEQVNERYFIIRTFLDQDVVDVCGQIVDDHGNPVEGVLIVGDSATLGAITDDKGMFSMQSIPYSSAYTIRHLGFHPRRLHTWELIAPECPQIAIIESVGLLEALTINDYLTLGILKEGNKITLYPAELKILPGLTEPDILQSIQLVPGISSPFETASGIHVRGGSPDQNLVLWNGIKTYNQGHLFGMLSAFNPYVAEEVTFIKNGTSPRYGERVSSVIDIKSSDEVAKKLSGGAGFNMIYGDAFVDVPIIDEKLSIQLSGRRSYTDLLETFTYKKFSDRVYQNTKIAETKDNQQSDNRFFFNDFSSNINYRLSKNDHLQLNTLYDQNRLNFSTISDSTSEKFTDELITSNEGYRIKWTHGLKDPFSFDINTYYSKYLLSYEFSSLLNDTLDLSTKKNLIRDYGGSFNLHYNFNNHHLIDFGYQFTNNWIRYAFENETPTYSLILDEAINQVRTHAAFANYKLFYRGGSSLTAGLRANYYTDLDKVYIEPRLYFEQKLSSIFSLTTSGEYRTQVASQIRESVVSDLSLENQVWTLSSKSGFPVTESYQLTFGGILDPDDWYLEAEGYLKEISGITTLTFGFLNPIGNEFSRGTSYIQGIDFFLKRQFSKYKSWLAYSYIRTENQFTSLNQGKPFPGNWNIEHTIKWSHFYTIDRFQFSLGWLWHTGKAYTHVNQQTPSNGPVSVVFDKINESNLPIYHRLDFSMIYDFFSSNDKIHYRIGLSLINIYNRRNQLNREYRTTPSLENRLIETNIYSLGITPNLVFRVFW